jgi:endonuclease YncB( thermonuclease family)
MAMGGWVLVVIVGLVAGSVCIARAQVATPAAASACRFEVVGAGKVAKILDGRSFLFDDGREVRLAGIEVPAMSGLDDASPPAPAAAAARTTLEAILAGESVELRQRGPAPADRYGRTVAYAYVTREGSERSAAHEMLARGYARVAAQIGHAACAAELFSRERMARAATLGLWAEPHYVVMGAEGAAELLAERGHFTVVEGKVLSVRESGGTIYMNFGRRWSQALTVTILKRHERIFTSAGLQPKMLENRRLRVRGWVEERNGPRIEATHPEQIEIAELN